MEEASESCPCSGDPDRCRASVVDAWRAGCLEEHCIFEGLAADRGQCREVLRKGLYDESRSASAETADLSEACKQVVLSGYPQGIKAVPEMFYEAFCGLMHYTIIHRFDLTPNGQPSADDVFQQAWLNLHEHLRKGACINRSLRTYVVAVTVNACAKAIRQTYRHTESRHVEVQERVTDVFASVPLSVIEWWEDWDRRLQRSDQCSAISRIILGHLCLDSWSMGTGISAQQLMAQWQQLVQMGEGPVRRLHETAQQQCRGQSDASPVHLVTGMINAGRLASYQLAVAFTAGMGLDLKESRHIITDMTDPPAGALHTRISRIKTALRWGDQCGRE